MRGKAAVEETARMQTVSRPTRTIPNPPDWHSRSAGPFAPLRMAVTSLRRTFGMLTAISLGMLVAIALICTVPLYTNLISEVHLHQTLIAQTPADLDIEVSAHKTTIQPGSAEAIEDQSNSLARRWIGDFAARSTSFLLASDPMNLTQVNGVDQAPRRGFTPTLPDDSQVEVYGFDLSQSGPHMRLFAGRLPQDTSADGIPEVLITNRMPHVNLGDTLTLQAFGAPDQNVRVRVVGIWYPKDATEAFWNGHSFDTRFSNRRPPEPPVFPIIFSTDTFISSLNFTLQRGEPPIGMVVFDIYLTDPNRITADRMTTILSNVKTFHAQISGNLSGRNGVFSIGFRTSLETILTGVQGELALVGIIVQAALSARQRLRQFAILRTLGTSGGQLLRMLLCEQLIVYGFGLLGGALLGIVLSTATLPFLQFSSSLTSPDQAGVPPYVLIFNLVGVALFYGALLLAFVAALLVAGQVAATVGLGKTLRLGED
jgi:hypothetical protein